MFLADASNEKEKDSTLNFYIRALMEKGDEKWAVYTIEMNYRPCLGTYHDNWKCLWEEFGDFYCNIAETGFEMLGVEEYSNNVDKSKWPLLLLNSEMPLVSKNKILTKRLLSLVTVFRGFIALPKRFKFHDKFETFLDFHPFENVCRISLPRARGLFGKPTISKMSRDELGSNLEINQWYDRSMHRPNTVVAYPDLPYRAIKRLGKREVMGNRWSRASE